MSDIRFEICPYSACAQQIVEFRNANRPIQRDRSYFDWRYRDRPAAQEARIVWGFGDDGRAVASASIIPHDFLLGDRVGTLGVLGDISVAPQCQGQGIATRMIQALDAAPELSGLAGCIVLPNEDAARSFERARWVDVALIERHVRILDVAPRLRRLPALRSAARWLAAPVNAALRLRSALPQVDPSFAIGPFVDAVFDASHDALWSFVAARGGMLAVRDRAYLDWRYTRHPSQRYQLMTVRRGDALCGYVVFHATQSDVVVDDFLSADAGAATAVVDGFVRRASAAGAATLHVRCAGDAQGPWHAAGFFKRRDSQRVMVHWAPGAPGPMRAGGWYVTAGDKDV